jgi:GNAT superfamily N-acetyltransferase
MITYEVHYLNEEEEPLGIEILDAVMDEFPEMTWHQSREEAKTNLIDFTRNQTRVEFLACDGEKLIGWASLMDDMDPNVGLCVSIHSFFVDPSYRGAVGTYLFREILGWVKRSDSKVLGYSHRVGEGKYVNRYIKLNPLHKENAT